MSLTSVINNSFYNEYGERWYTAFDDPVAILRAENKTKFPWILEKLRKLGQPDAAILDVGCGGGFLTNELAKHGYSVTGVDLSPVSLNVAKAYDSTGTVKYQVADAHHLPFPDHSFHVVCGMDFLEHVEDPEKVIAELCRVLKPDGLLFFHTFNRNFMSWLVVIKLMEWFVKNTPERMHVKELFITPKELRKYCENAQVYVVETTGIRLKPSSIDWRMLKSGIVSDRLEFTLTKSLMISYLGVGRKR